MKKVGVQIIQFVLIILFFFNARTYGQMFGQEPEERVRTYDVLHIKIDVKLDLEKKTVDGITETTIVPLSDNFNKFDVDAVGMEIKDVKFYSKKHEGYEVKFNYDKKILSINLPVELTNNDTIIYVVEYFTKDPEKGMYFISPDSLFPNKPYQVWTQGEGEDNRYWFPCFDYPNDKSTTETIITVDKKYITLSNGDLIDTKDNNDGTLTWHWNLSLPHSSYLVMLTAGNFDIVEDNADGIPIYSYVPKGRKSDGEISYKLTADMVKFFNDKIGFKYPWGRFSQIVVEDFIYGGMENTGAVVLTDGSVHNEKTIPDYTATGLVAHELSHQWWGDVTTCKNWNEIWLNESFATYFEELYKEYHFGKDEFDYGIMRNGEGAIWADSNEARIPIYSRNGLTVNTYDKGGVVLHMLRNLIGTDNFWIVMNKYITKYQFQPVVTQNLLDAVNDVMNEPGKNSQYTDYKWFFDEWIYKAGQPEYKVKYSFDDKNNEVLLTVQQIQRMDTSGVFQIPVQVEIITEKNIFTQQLVTNEIKNIFRIKVDGKPLNLLFNKNNNVLSKLYFDKPKEMWIYQLEKSKDAIDRITAINGLKSFKEDEVILNAIFNIIKTDNFWGTRNEAITYLENSKDKQVSEKLITIYKNESDSRVKRTIIRTIGNNYSNCSDCADKDKLKSFMQNELKSETRDYVISVLLENIAKVTDNDKIYDLISPYLQKDSHNEVIRRSAIEAIDIKDIRVIDVLIEIAKTGKTNRVRNTALGKLREAKFDQKILDLFNSKVTEKSRWTRFMALNYIEKNGNKTSIPFLEKVIIDTKDEAFSKRVTKVLKKVKGE